MSREINNKYINLGLTGNGGGTTYTAGEYISIAEDVISVTGITPDLYLTSADTQDFVTEADITAATHPIEEHLNDVEYVTATALTELHDAILEISGSTGGSNYIIPAITSQTDYEAISGDVKTGDLIQVYGADINGDGGEAYGLFQAEVDQGSSSISWKRKDNEDSLMWADKMYPWMAENDVWPADFGEGHFLISTDDNSEDEAYNGIGFDAEGKPVITHIVPQYENGEITGITREDTPIGADMSAYYTSAQTDAEITGATSNMKTYVDNRIDGYNTASTITITSTPMTEGYWLDFSEDTSTPNGPEFQMFKTNKSNLVVADISSLNSGGSDYTQPDWGVYLMGYDSADQAYDIQMIVDLPSSVSLTPQNYNMDIPFIVGTSPVNRVALEWNNLSSVGYPNYFIYNTDTKIGHFAYDLNINEFVPGVVKSDGEITKVKKVTQAEYDAIVTPDASTLYIIINN